MAGNDVYLRSVPTDSNANDPRLRDPTVADAGGASEALSGSATLTLTATGDLLSTTTLIGAASLALTATGAFLSTTALTGAASLVLTASGALVSTTALSGSASLVLTATGELASTVALSGAASLALTASCALVSTTSLSGAATLALTASGELTAATSLGGEATLTLEATGDLTVADAAPVGVPGGGTGWRYRGNVGKLTSADWDKARKAFAKARRKRKELEDKLDTPRPVSAERKLEAKIDATIDMERAAKDRMMMINAAATLAYLADATAFYAEQEEEEMMIIMALAA